MTFHEIRTRLPYTGAFAVGAVLGHIVGTATPGVEEWRDGWYRRTVRLAGGPAIVALRVEPGEVSGRLWLTDPADESDAVRRCRRLLDLDADLDAVRLALGADPVLAPLIAEQPGQRIPGSLDPAELAIKVVLGQQISTARARVLAGQLAERYGERVADPDGGLTHLFPRLEVIAGIDPADLPMPRQRGRAVTGVAHLLATGTVDLTDVPATRRALAAVPGIGPWTVELVAMRGLGDPDAFPATDLGIRKAIAALPPTEPDRWRPWRSYATQQLWASGDHEVNRLIDT